MTTDALIGCIIGFAFFGVFAAILGWGAWYSPGRQ
jgi:hypothetical protein